MAHTTSYWQVTRKGRNSTTEEACSEFSILQRFRIQPFPLTLQTALNRRFSTAAANTNENQPRRVPMRTFVSCLALYASVGCLAFMGVQSLAEEPNQYSGTQSRNVVRVAAW